MKNDSVEFVVDGLEAIALIIRAEFDEPGISFFTPDSFSQQIAYMKHPKGKTIEPHVHNLISRQVQYTQEVLFVKMGSLKIDLYSSKRKFISSHVLNGGDAVLLCGGGHSFQMLEETSFIEVKQGPYAGDNDKVRFEGGK